MRYKWIELYGYAGFYNGMGIDQIKIDFTKCKTNKIIIRGGNGSGKSTLLNAINPIRDGNDKFIPNMEARKNICITDNGIDYIIRYIHPVTNSGRGTTKGYISKMINGQFVELNPNGNISSCENILYEEFGLDPTFISLSSLSSENRGLVDSRPAERKKLINSIISTLEVYNGIYKNLSKKASTFRQLINSLTYKIDYIGNEVQLNAKLQNIENRLVALEQEKTTTIEAIASVKLKISEYINILNDNNYDSVVSELKDISSHNKVLRSKILKKVEDLGIDNLDNIDTFNVYLDKQITILESTIKSIKEQTSSLLSQRELEYRDLQSKQQKLESLQSEYNYLDIKKAVEQARSLIKEYDDIFSRIGVMNINLITKSEYDSAMESLKYLKDAALSLTSIYHQEDIIFVIENDFKVFNDVSSIPHMKKLLDEARQEKSNLDTQIAIFLSKADLINELNNRPSGCNIDDCPYIKSAIEASVNFPKDKLINMQIRSDELDKDIKEYEKKIDLYTERGKILDIIKSIERELNSRIKFISKLPLSPNFQNTFLRRIGELDSFKDIDNMYQYVDYGNMIEEYNVAQAQLIKYESEYKIYEAKNDIIESIIKDVESLTKKTDDLMIQIDTLNSNIINHQQKLDEYNNAKTIVVSLIDKIKNDLKPSEEREAELIKIKQILDINSVEIERLQKELGILNTNFGAVSNDIKNLTEERDSIKHSLILLSDYKMELEEYNRKNIKIEKIRYYSSPSTGIQTLFMQLYMNKIINTANNLLSMLFEGEFVLQPFIINENEFRIPCLGHGLIHDDISSMSTAQKCMISMILSFSILHQSSTKYNVISIDELDGGLDTMNRGFFIELLDKIMYMLNCEQCFIISHNNELTTSTADLIILKNNSGDIYDGNVIWQY